MSRKIAFPVIIAIVTLVAGLVPTILAAAAWIRILAPCAALAVGAFIAKLTVDDSSALADWPQSTRNRLVALITLGGALDVALDVAYTLGALPLVDLLGLVVVVGATHIGAAYLGVMTRPQVDRRIAAAQAELSAFERDRILEQEVKRDGDKVAAMERVVMRKALATIDMGHMEVVASEQMCGEMDTAVDTSAFGVRYTLLTPASALGKSGKKTFGPALAEDLAIAYNYWTHLEIEARWVRIAKARQAGSWLVSVACRDILARVVPYVDDLTVADINDPAPIGIDDAARRAYLHLRQHGQYIGKSRSGKTSMIHAVLAYLTRCHNAVVWICGTEKLYDMVQAWLKVYLDTDEDMPFDWVRYGAQHTVEMMAAFMRVARYRQSLDYDERENLPAVILILDEASFALRNTTVTAEFDGRDLTMSELAGMIGQGAGSADCYAHYSTQRDTNDQKGNQGGDIDAQMGFTVGFATADQNSIGRLMGNHSLPAPVHKGQAWLKDDLNDDNPDPQLVKAFYLQEKDPSKRKLHNGLTNEDVAWSRRVFPHVMDEGSARAAGPDYLNRPRKVTRAFLEYLKYGSGAPADRPTATTASAATTAEDEALTQFIEALAGKPVGEMTRTERAMFAEMARAISDESDRLTERANAPAAKNLTERITRVLRDSDKPLRVRRIVELVNADGGDAIQESSVTSCVSRMKSAGTVSRDADYAYALTAACADAVAR
jgi:hypothetical protein